MDFSFINDVEKERCNDRKNDIVKWKSDNIYIYIYKIDTNEDDVLYCLK